MTKKQVNTVELTSKELKQANENIKALYDEIKLTKEYKNNVLNNKNIDLTRQAILLNKIEYQLNKMYSMLAFYESQFNAIEGNTSADIYLDKSIDTDIVNGITLETYGLN